MVFSGGFPGRVSVTGHEGKGTKGTFERNTKVACKFCVP